MKRLPILGWGLCAAISLVAGPTSATPTTYDVFLNGASEVGNGDPKGIAFGTLTVDPAAITQFGTLPVVIWDIIFENLTTNFFDPWVISGWHLHGPAGPAGTNAPVLINLSGFDGQTLPNGTLSGGKAIALEVANAILANPTDFYLNLHTDDPTGLYQDFSSGAVRGQVPEPSTATLLGLGLAALTANRVRYSVSPSRRVS